MPSNQGVCRIAENMIFFGPIIQNPKSAAKCEWKFVKKKSNTGIQAFGKKWSSHAAFFSNIS